MGRRAIVFAASCAALAFLVFGGAAAAAGPPSIALVDGETAPVFSYADAIRERVFVPVAGVDQDADGVTDRVALDIIRPQETDSGLQVPAIVVPSPYYTSIGKGNETQYLHTTGGVADFFPLFYDNYFVPRGYAVILAEALGTGFSTGCPLHGGPGDIAAMTAVIDWLQGRVQGFDAVSGGNAVVANWDNGKAAMIGKSYDGTLANGVAATGVAGLTTIVPLSAISSWYDYSRTNGVRHNVTHYPASLSSTITQNITGPRLGEAPPSRNALCAATRTAMSTEDGDDSGDVNAFWEARDYRASVANVHASVFESHGLNDDNVRTDQFSAWWAGLAAHDVPRKLWLSQEGHVDPFDYRRAEWVDTLHRWFDYWLQGVPNGIMLEPRVTIERAPDDYVNEADWPAPGTSGVDLFLNGTAAGSAGRFGPSAGGGTTSTLSFVDLPNQSEGTMIGAPTGSQANRLVFLSPVLQHDVRISGVPAVDLGASLDKTSGNLGAILVDYSTAAFPRTGRAGSDGIANAATTSCWGDSTALDSACYRDESIPVQNVTTWRVAKGILDAGNRDSLTTPSPLLPGQAYDFSIPLLPNDYVFAAGHQIGVVVVSSYRSFGAVTDPSVPTVTVDTHLSKLVLPVVGGDASARAAGVFAYDTTAPVLQLPGPITVEATGPATPVTYTAGATDDQDASPPVSCTPASGSGFAVGATTVHCSAEDAAGNSSSGTFQVTVTDTAAPSLHLPAAVGAEATSPDGAAVAYTATAVDLADPAPAVTCSPASGSVFAIGPTIVHCDARDASGNTATDSFTLTVVDTTPPQLHLPAAGTTEAESAAGAHVSYAAAASDLADPAAAVSCLPASGSVFPIGTTTVHCDAQDASGNTASGDFAVTVADTTAPSLHLPAGPTAEATSASGAHVSYTATAADLVDPAVAVACTPASGAVFSIGTTTVHCETRDASGNTAAGDFAVAVADTTAPTLHLPAPIVAEAVDSSGAPVSFAATAADLVDPSAAVSCLPLSGSVFPIGTTTVDCRAEDASGNHATETFTITVRDTTAPTLHLPAPISAAATVRAGVAVDYTVTAGDDVDPAPTTACLPTSGSTFPIGTTKVVCIGTDSHGNTSTGLFVVTVADEVPRGDTTVPVLRLPSRIDASATSAAGAAVTFDVTATDDRDPSTVVLCLPTSGSTFPIGTTTVRCTARDRAENAATGSFEVVVADAQPPVLGLPGRIAVDATSPAGARVAYRAEAIDAVDAEPKVSCEPASGSTFRIGRTIVRCTAVDASGNEARGSFTVEVRGTATAVRELRKRLLHARGGKQLARTVGAIVRAASAGKHGAACTRLAALRHEVGRRRGAKTLLAETARLSRLLRCRLH